MRLLQSLPADRQASRRRERRLRRVATLPSLVTLGNLICGFAAIYCGLLSVQANGTDLSRLTLRSPLLERMAPTYLAIGGYLIFAAMICDAIDGRLARATRKTSDFGGQLDSLADVISFGAAPAVLMICLVMPALPGQPDTAVGGRIVWRISWVAAAGFVLCTALRLARFNVENVHDESAHLRFRGLPAPGAAGALASLVILHEDVIRTQIQWASRWLVMILPIAAIGLAVLMVSRLRYVHFVNMYLRGRRPISHLVTILLVLAIAWIYPQLVLALLVWGYALSGPAARLWPRLIGLPRGAPSAPTEQAPARSQTV